MSPRRFVITMPGLTAGAPGAVVTAEHLAMDDDELDEFIEAGFASEIHQDEYAPEPEPEPAYEAVPESEPVVE